MKAKLENYKELQRLYLKLLEEHQCLQKQVEGYQTYVNTIELENTNLTNKVKVLEEIIYKAINK